MLRFRLSLPLFAVSVAASLFVGCNSRQTRVLPPAISAQDAARAALAEYDANGDGMIDAAELDKSPALMSSLKNLDKNGDGKLSVDEISGRIEEWQASKVAIMPFSCKITLNGKPLVGAAVTLVPEKFLGPNVSTATGVTSDQGFVSCSIPKDKLPNPNMNGVNCGLYKVEITKQEGGKDLVPAAYNTATTLGVEVAQQNPDLQRGVTYDLKSKGK